MYSDNFSWFYCEGDDAPVGTSQCLNVTGVSYSSGTLI
jgi:hypothetical protein